MSRNLVRPFFPVPPAEYSALYMTEVVRSFSVYLNQMQNPGEGRNTGLVLTALQTDDYGLETGALFQQEGFVKIALSNVASVRSSVATSRVGQVTVVIS